MKCLLFLFCWIALLNAVPRPVAAQVHVTIAPRDRLPADEHTLNTAGHQGYSPHLFALENLTCPEAAARVAATELEAWQSHVTSALMPFANARGCVVPLTSNYWQVEVCPGRWIRQFTLQGNRVEREYFLGLQRHWTGLADDGTSVVTDSEIAYTSAPPTTVPTRIREGGDLPKGHLTGDAQYECTRNTAHGYLEVTANYAGGSFCPRYNVYRSTTLHMICDPRRHLPLVATIEASPCHYDVVLASRLLCELMGANLTVRETPVKRLKTDPSGHQVWHTLEDSDMLFSL